MFNRGERAGGFSGAWKFELGRDALEELCVPGRLSVQARAQCAEREGSSFSILPSQRRRVAGSRAPAFASPLAWAFAPIGQQEHGSMARAGRERPGTRCCCPPRPTGLAELPARWAAAWWAGRGGGRLSAAGKAVGKVPPGPGPAEPWCPSQRGGAAGPVPGPGPLRAVGLTVPGAPARGGAVCVGMSRCGRAACRPRPRC